MPVERDTLYRVLKEYPRHAGRSRVGPEGPRPYKAAKHLEIVS